MAGTSEALDDYLSPQKAAESRRLDNITEEVCQWLSQTLSVEITDRNYMEKLETGVELCRLQNKLCAALGGQKIEYHDDAEKHPQFARQNIEHFVKWCKDAGCHQLFEPNDLVVKKGMLNETKEQVDQNMKRRCKSVILCLHQLKKKHDRVMRVPSEGEENKRNMTVTMADETDSTNIVVTTPAQETDRNQSDAPQISDTSPPTPKPESQDEEKETSDIKETAPGESKSTPTTPGSNESSRAKEDEKKRDGEITPTPAPAVPSVANTAYAPLPPVIRGYFYPVLFLCIFPLVFMVGFYYLKRRK
jgi:hypothetical protein